MKNLYRMYILIIMIIGVVFSNDSFSQSTNPGNIYSGGFIGWNNTNNANPLLFKTNNENRMKLNGNLNYSINGYNAPRNGNLLIGRSNSALYNNNIGAYALWHIDGPGTFSPTAGFRPWMQTGVTLTGNNDLSYMGLRQVGSQRDFTETLIAWTDNTVGEYGPDDMVFRFLGEGNGSTTISSNLNTINDLDGRHIARFAPSGEFGLGNTFGINPTGTPSNLYVRPQSLMHLS